MSAEEILDGFQPYALKAFNVVAVDANTTPSAPASKLKHSDGVRHKETRLTGSMYARYPKYGPRNRHV